MVVGLLYGARVSLTVGLVATFGAVLFGVIIGAVAGTPAAGLMIA